MLKPHPFLADWLAQHRRYGAEVNTHDLIKALAVIIMITDHVGIYLSSDNMWLRAIGRIGFPVWFFMAGYSKQGSISTELVPGALFLAVTKHMHGFKNVLPINALATIFLIRAMLLFIPPNLHRLTPFFTPFICVAALLLSAPTGKLVEYGSVGLLFGYMGYAVRNTPDDWPRRLLALGCFAVFVITQQRVFPFNVAQSAIMILGTAGFMYWLYYFKTYKFPNSESWWGLGPVIRGLGRHTLLIYVLHLSILFAIASAHARGLI